MALPTLEQAAAHLASLGAAVAADGYVQLAVPYVLLLPEEGAVRLDGEFTRETLAALLAFMESRA